MRRDWDRRAKENAHYYVASGRDNWSEEEFYRSGEQQVEEQVLTDPFDYAAEDALMDSWLSARASVDVPDFAVPPRWGLAYTGPDGRPRTHAGFAE